MSILSPRIDAMLDSIRRASRQVMRDFNELQISNVKSADFINKTYSRSKETIYTTLYNYRKDYQIVSEDDDFTINEEDYTWLTIPIEGRTNFINCIVYFTISVCLLHKNKVIAAAVDAPALRETFWAEEKRGAFFEDSRSRCIKMRVKNREEGLIDVSGNLLNKLSITNVCSLGSTVLGFTYLAAGRHRGIIYDGSTNKYKILLGGLFLQESCGGKVREDNGLVTAGISSF
ncbi:inositol monophosphatase [Wolbachia pipientis]|uniref:Inositol monophosphatase n=1 Tax=Wolbachia pipientis TaxID=955 RepID=A0A1E7QJT3_WOLPI|nr:inositol monophosphatase family protein [Wolbachia pipientis]OEY86606.1 inositol monophosphatase [Wolbachia pipientis]